MYDINQNSEDARWDQERMLSSCIRGQLLSSLLPGLLILCSATFLFSILSLSISDSQSLKGKRLFDSHNWWDNPGDELIIISDPHCRKARCQFSRGAGGSKIQLEIVQQSSMLQSISALDFRQMPPWPAHIMCPFLLRCLWTWVVTATRQLPTGTLAAGARWISSLGLAGAQWQLWEFHIWLAPYLSPANYSKQSPERPLCSNFGFFI